MDGQKKRQALSDGPEGHTLSPLTGCMVAGDPDIGLRPIGDDAAAETSSLPTVV